MRFDIPDLNVPGCSVLRGSSLAFLLVLSSHWHEDQLLGPKGRARVDKNNSRREAVSAHSGHASIDCECPFEVLLRTAVVSPPKIVFGSHFRPK